MGTWGITERENDNGLDLLDLIIVEQLKQNDFKVFHVADAMALLRQQILVQIKQANRGCPPEKLESFISESYPQKFTHAALLLAECLEDYYRSGELVIIEYVGDDNDPVERHIKEFAVTETDLTLLLDELRKVQNPEHELYQSWFKEETRQEWLTHIRAVQQSLEKNL